MAKRTRTIEIESTDNLDVGEIPEKYKKFSEADHRFITVLLDQLSSEEIRMIVNLLKIRISGFTTKKSIKNVPLQMLKRPAIERLQVLHRTHRIKGFLSTFYGPYLEVVSKHDDLQSFYWFNNREDVTLSAKMAVFMLHFGEFLNEHVDVILDNISLDMPFLCGLVEKPSAHTTSSLEFNAWTKNELELWKKHNLELNGIVISPEDSLNIVIDYENFVDPGVATSILLQYPDKWKILSQDDQLMIIEQAFADAVRQLRVAKVEATDLVSEHKTLQELTQSHTSKLDKLTADKKKADEELRENKAKVTEYTKQLKALEKENTQLDAVITKLQQQIESIQVQHVQPILADEGIQIISFQSRESINDYVDESLVQVVKTVAAMKTSIERTKKSGASKLWFIDTESCSTKQVFEIEKVMETLEVPYRLLSGTTIEFIQKIIVNVEGEMRYEAH